MKNLSELVGKRILYNLKWDDNDRYVYETVVGCLSPSGKYVDLGHQWYRCEDINILEILGDAKEGGDEKSG